MMDLTARAMNICQSHAEFASSIFVSDHQIPEGKWQREYVHDMGDLNGYNRFVSQNLPKYCNTDFLLLIQWDGYILDPNAWRDEFLEYDYIGAVWPWHLTNRVGNGGFCIRSKKFMEAVGAMNFPSLEEFYSDDVNPCRVWRKELEGKRNHLQNQMATLQRDLHNIDGALTQLSSDAIYICDAEQFSAAEPEAAEIAPAIAAPEVVSAPAPSIRVPSDWKVTGTVGVTATHTKAPQRKGKGNGASRQSPDQ